MSNTFKFSSRSEKNLQGVNPDLVKVTRRALEISEVDFGITEGLRSRYRQKQLVATGKSQTMNSRHLTGHAVDVVAYIGSQCHGNGRCTKNRSSIQTGQPGTEYSGGMGRRLEDPERRTAFSVTARSLSGMKLWPAGRRFSSDCRPGSIHASVVVTGPGERQKRSAGQHPEKYRRHPEYHQRRGTRYAAGAGTTPRGKSATQSGRRDQT